MLFFTSSGIKSCTQSPDLMMDEILSGLSFCPNGTDTSNRRIRPFASNFAIKPTLVILKKLHWPFRVFVRSLSVNVLVVIWILALSTILLTPASIRLEKPSCVCGVSTDSCANDPEKEKKDRNNKMVFSCFITKFFN